MITSLYAAILALIYIALSVNTIKGRRKHKVTLGDADNFDMKRRIRAHANFGEYTPLFIILLALAEMNGLPTYAIHLLGGVFVLGRIMHAHSILSAETYVDGKISANPIWRIRGMICTFNALGALSIVLIVQSILAIK